MRVRLLLGLVGLVVGSAASTVAVATWSRAVPVAAAAAPSPLPAPAGTEAVPAPAAVPAPQAQPPSSEAAAETGPEPGTAAPTEGQTAASGPAPAARPEAPAARNPLGQRLQDLLDTAVVNPGGRIGLVVIDERGRLVAGQAPDEAVLPASTLKLVTAAAVLLGLGPEHRFTTTVAGTAAVMADGTLAGDIVLMGGGDPVLATPLFGTVDPERPRTPLESLADQIVASGVRAVTGSVLGDATAWADEPAAPGWLPRYFEELDATPSSALTAEAGRRLAVRDGRLVGEPAPDPSAEAAASLWTLLAERGVVLGGQAGATTAPLPAVAPLGSVTSPPVRDLVRFAVQRSDNHVADALFRALGAAAGDPTWAGSAAAAERALAPLGLAWAGTRLADGSGLSRLDRASPTLLAGLLQRMPQTVLADEWDGVLAVAGESGTLRRRLVGTVAEHRLRGKTGSLADVRALAGTVVGPQGHTYSFALLGTELADGGVTAVRALQDALVLALAEDLYGCRRVPGTATGSPTSTASASPSPVLVCAA